MKGVIFMVESLEKKTTEKECALHSARKPEDELFMREAIRLSQLAAEHGLCAAVQWSGSN